MYKNNSLQNNLDKLKQNFSEQINGLTNQVDDMNKKHNFNMKQFQETFENKLKFILDEKENEVVDLRERIDQLEHINREISLRYEETLKINHELKNSINEKIAHFEQQLLKKDEEIIKFRESSNSKMINFERAVQDEKNNVINRYEVNIERLITELETSKEKMTNIIHERERDIRSIIDKHKSEYNNYEHAIKVLKEEIECHKTNILALRDKKMVYENEIHDLKLQVDRFKKENKFNIAEIKSLDGQNKMLIHENVS